MTAWGCLPGASASLRAFHFRRGGHRSAYRLRSPWATQPPASLRAFLLRRFSHRPRRRTGPRDQSSDSVRGPFFLSSHAEPIPHHGRLSFAPRALGYFAASNLRSRGRNWLHDGPLRDGLGAAYQVPRQASELFTSERAATAPRPDFGAPGPPSTARPQGRSSPRVFKLSAFAA